MLEAYQWLGGWAWLAAWTAAGVFTAALMLAAPVWILPLFNTFRPLEDGALRQAIEAYASDQGFALGGIFVMDGSKRSAKANAFFTGFGRTKRISLYDTLLDKLNQDQVVAVLAHEVGHARGRHLLKGLTLALLKMGAIFGLLQVFLGWGGHAAGLRGPDALGSCRPGDLRHGLAAPGFGPGRGGQRLFPALRVRGGRLRGHGAGRGRRPGLGPSRPCPGPTCRI